MSMAQSECLTYFIIHKLFHRVKPVDCRVESTLSRFELSFIIQYWRLHNMILILLLCSMRTSCFWWGLVSWCLGCMCQVSGWGGRGYTGDTGLTINKKWFNTSLSARCSAGSGRLRLCRYKLHWFRLAFSTEQSRRSVLSQKRSRICFFQLALVSHYIYFYTFTFLCFTFINISEVFVA